MASEASIEHRLPFASARAYLSCVALTAIAAAVAIASPSSAAAPTPLQEEEVTAPPQPDQGLTYSSPVGGYGLMALAGAALIGVSLLPSKRGHQD